MLPPRRLGGRALQLAVLVVVLAGAAPDTVPDAVVGEVAPPSLEPAPRRNYGGLPPLSDGDGEGSPGRVVVAVRSPARRSGPPRLLSRQRRYVVFPKGSSIQMVAEFTVGEYVPFTTIFTTGLTWGIAWRLPTHSYELYLNKRAAGEDPDQEHRAQLLDDLAVFLDKFGVHGEHCVRRTLCELQARRGVTGGFMEELLKAVFTSPANDTDSTNATCEARFPHGVSILDVRPDMNAVK